MVDATIHLLDRGNVEADANHILEGLRMGTADEPDPENVVGEGPVYNLVIDHPEATILWDTGSHPEAGEGHWPDDLYASFHHADAGEHRLEDALGAAGYDLADIDCVVATHLHMDHAGGLRHFAGTDVPVVVHQDELQYAYYSATTDEGADTYVAGDFHHDLNWEVIKRERASYFADVEFVHLPGHTPGLLGTVLHLDGYGTVILTGDQAYVGLNYEEGWPLGAKLLWSRPHWEESLELVRDLERRHDAEVYYGHDPDTVEALEGGLP